jgi:hypothetical protein
MNQTTLRTILAAVVIAAAAPQARAGTAIHSEVTVSSKAASGDTNDARQSADNLQFIGCGLTYDAASDKTEVNCVARDKFEKALNCSSTKPGFVAVAAGIGDYAFISFNCLGTELTKLHVEKFSFNLP